jgi:hypothetical protein
MFVDAPAPVPRSALPQRGTDRTPTNSAEWAVFYLARSFTLGFVCEWRAPATDVVLSAVPRAPGGALPGLCRGGATANRALPARKVYLAASLFKAFTYGLHDVELIDHDTVVKYIDSE